MFKLTLYCLSVTVEDLNLYQRYRYEDINISGTRYFAALNSTLGVPNFSCPCCLIKSGGITGTFSPL